MSDLASDAFVEEAAAVLLHQISIRPMTSTTFSSLRLQTAAVIGGGFDV